MYQKTVIIKTDTNKNILRGFYGNFFLSLINLAFKLITLNTITKTLEASPNAVQRTSSTPAMTIRHPSSIDDALDAMSPIFRPNNPTPINKTNRKFLL
jgi:hypothetical protein